MVGRNGARGYGAGRSGARRYGAAWRWGVVAVLLAVLVALPPLVGALPASDTDTSAADLRRTALASADIGFSGYAQSAGGLSLPVTDQLTSVADLLSDRTTLRVWWRAEDDARIDVVTPTGETGVHRDAEHIWTWEYESATASWAHPRPLALPSSPDLLPSTLARRLLSEATDTELSRLPAERVAGRDALGLRVVPAEPASSVAAVDVWVDADSGLPLRVRVTGRDGRVALDSRFLDVELVRPPAEVTRFRPPPGARVVEDRSYDVLEAARGIGGDDLPPRLVGLDRRSIEGTPRAVAAYGRGATLLTVTPVPGRLAAGLRSALRSSPEALVDELGIRLGVGPLGLMLVDPPTGRAYVLTGTVTANALAEAARALPALGSRA